MALPHGHNLAREIRKPGSWKSLGPGSPAPWTVVPTSQARLTVRRYHQQGRGAAVSYVAAGPLTRWTGSSNPGIVTNVTRVRAGLEWYFNTDQADGRTVLALEPTNVVRLAAGTLAVRTMSC